MFPTSDVITLTSSLWLHRLNVLCVLSTSSVSVQPQSNCCLFTGTYYVMVLNDLTVLDQLWRMWRSSWLLVYVYLFLGPWLLAKLGVNVMMGNLRSPRLTLPLFDIRKRNLSTITFFPAYTSERCQVFLFLAYSKYFSEFWSLVRVTDLRND